MMGPWARYFIVLSISVRICATVGTRVMINVYRFLSLVPGMWYVFKKVVTSLCYLLSLPDPAHLLISYSLLLGLQKGFLL